MGESPVKKLDFESSKENSSESTPATEPELKKPSLELAKSTESTTPQRKKTWQELEREEPILIENPRRFVLFPIQYHEVSLHTSTTRHALSGFRPPANNSR